MTTFTRRDVGKLAAGAAATGAVAPAAAQAPQFFRIGTGGTAGTYYPVGGMIANAISEPPALVLTAVASNGSVANVNAIMGGSMESGFSQADVASWAYSGTGVFEGRPRAEALRAICNLYPESIHLVARRGLNIRSPADLRGKRVSLDEPGSGTLINARLILAAYGVSERDVRAEYLKPNQAAEKMRDGSCDAFIFVGGYPAAAITELASSGHGIDLVPIEGPPAEAMMAQHRFYAADEIPANTYRDVPAVKTIAVGAQWVTSTRIPEELVYRVTRAMWSDRTRQVLDAGHAKGRSIRRETALAGLGIPLHPGAERFYREAGILR